MLHLLFNAVLGILVLAGLLLLPVLLPIAFTSPGVKADNTTSEGTFNDIDKLSMGHIEVSFFLLPLRVRAEVI